MTQDELDIKGSKLEELTNRVGVSSLDDEEARTLYFYMTWKDGADWSTIEEHQADPFWDADTARELLLSIYCLKP